MEKVVWDKVKQFLESLRCEDIDRESMVDTPELQEAKELFSDKAAIYQHCIADFPQKDQKKIEDYVEALKSYSYEECQQAYLQGIVDCMLILYSAGILKPRQELEALLKAFI